MSVIDIVETAARGSDHQHERDFSIRHEFTREFIVITSNGDDNAVVVKKGRGVPKIGDSFGSGTDAVCQNVLADRDPEKNTVWHVTAEYLSLESDENEEKTNERINAQVMSPPKIRTGFISHQKPVEKDIYSDPIVNSAGDPFTPRPLRETKTLWIDVTRFEHDSSAGIFASRFGDTINSDYFWGCLPGQVKLADISGERMAMQTQFGWFFYWRANYRFYFRKGGWMMELLDQGMYELVDKPNYSADGVTIIGYNTDGTTTPILGKKTEMPITQPVRFNGNGHPLADPKDTSVFLEFEVNHGAFFNWLNMPPLLVRL